MKVTPDDYGRRCQFDHFCKLVLYHEAVDYFRERKRQRGWETSFETLPLSELDTLCTIDQYPSDSFIFPAYGCELQISDGLVVTAFASLPQPGTKHLDTALCPGTDGRRDRRGGGNVPQRRPAAQD